jgi:hypothetical protein
MARARLLGVVARVDCGAVVPRMHARKRTTVKRRDRDTRAFRALCKLAERFPGMERSTSYGTPALKVKGKFLARLRTEAEGWLAIRCDFVEREMLLQAAPHIFHVTPHYQDYPMILIDLDVIERDALLDIVEKAWRMCATKTLIREHEGRAAG